MHSVIDSYYNRQVNCVDCFHSLNIATDTMHSDLLSLYDSERTLDHSLYNEYMYYMHVLNLINRYKTQFHERPLSTR